jgi:hypothetical protein
MTSPRTADRKASQRIARQLEPDPARRLDEHHVAVADQLR